MTQSLKFYFDFLNQSSRALYIFLEASKIPFEAIPISMVKGEHLTGEFRDKVNRFRKLPAITDHGYQLSESVAIFRHLSREKLVPEHWYPRRQLGRSRTDEYLAWQQTNMDVACTDYFQQKWLIPHLQKTRASDTAINTAGKHLEGALNDFEQLFLSSHNFILGENISFADLSAICEIDQTKSVGFSTFKNRHKLSRWYNLVRDELGPYYKNVHDQFDAALKQSNQREQRQGEVQAHALKQ
ncbi:hypothetical protein KR044_004473 [Drosophila immigrans]|nr:hypothetical protein KR044_004473 [Drosophila immigrans]